MDYKHIFDIKGKNILVTGSCGLLGKTISEALCQFGANTILIDIAVENEEFSKYLNEKYAVNSIPINTDICSEDSVNRLVEIIRDKKINLHGLVNNAYPRNKKYGTKYENLEYGSWRENIDLHLNGYFNMTHKISKLMIEQKMGCIINMCSIYGFLGPDFSIYTGTSMTMPAEYSVIKGGILNFTRYLATYLAEYKIRVNAVSPGGIENKQPESFISNYNARTPLNRMGTPSDIVGSIVFLLSEASSYITGQNIIVDGGWSVW